MVSRTLNSFIAGFTKHELMTLAAALAFYTALSLPALLFLLLLPVKFLGQDAENHFFDQVRSMMGSQAGSAIRTVAESAAAWPRLGSLAGVIGILTFIFSASGVFSQLLSSLNVIWESDDRGGWWLFFQKRIFSFGLILAFASIALLSLVASGVLTTLFPVGGELWKAVNEVLTAIVVSLIFASIFKFLPPTEVSWRHAFVGGFLTGLLFTFGKILIGIYLEKNTIGAQYGTAGSLAVLLVWIYYSSLIFFVGAEFTHAAYGAETEDGK